MGYTFTCNVCHEDYNHEPPFMGDFWETFLKTSDSDLTQRFNIGETLTVCRDCSEELFL